jgi:phosphopantothenoylcysteine decarboxylase/phosphopantothenate--cysteine ligase
MATHRREILLGVGGGIAAYKSCELLRRLQDEGFAVTVVPTPSSLNFVGRATWEALSGREATASVFESVDQIRHVSLAKLAEAIIIAPATADLIARIAQGRADDLLTNIILASQSPILIVPAMHPAMWSNPATVANIETLRARGIDVMDPDTGALTSGDSGKGRFPETSAIIATFTDSTLAPSDLQGKKVIVTAGGTREAIDPVRFIGNRSSGKQGVAIAEAALRRGAHVTLIAANIEIDVDPRIALVRVESALQMSQELNKHFPLADFLFMAAAVADARVQTIHGEKIKKRDFSTIELVENPDLLQTLSDVKSKQVVLAFAAETDISGDINEAIKAARIKMTRKGADFIFLNDVSHGGIFGSDETAGWIVLSDEELQVPLCSKKHLAHLLISRALSRANQLS